MPAATAPRLIVLLASALPLLGATPPTTTPAARPSTTPRYEENVEVVETSVLVVPPTGVRKLSSAKTWMVRENGADRPVERVEEVSDEPWETLIWVDGPLCRQDALARTLLAVAHQAETLTRHSTVRVVVADPEPHTELQATREPRAVVETLARLSTEALCARTPDGLVWRARGFASAPKTVQGVPVAAAPPSPTLPAASAAMQELRTLVTTRTERIAHDAGVCHGAACALLLVADGYPLDPDLELPDPVRAAADADLRQALRDATDSLAKRLTLAHWLLIALPFSPPAPDPDAETAIPKGARRGPEPFPDRGDYGPPGAPTFGYHPGSTKGPAPRAYDVYAEIHLAPLRKVAELTAGLIVRVPEQLPGALESLRGRRWIWYRTARFGPQEARTLEVLAGKPGQRVLAPAWIGSTQ